MKISVVNPGSFKLDGGATFGVVPKVMWSKVYPADENNLCNFSLRSLVIETGNRVVLIDTGIGNKQDEKFYKYYFREGHHSIEKSLNEVGYKSSQITDVIITHLHFDHVGDAVKKDESGNLSPRFKNAKYHMSKAQWEWAINPNQREKASFLTDNFMPLHEAGVINLIEEEGELLPGINLRLFKGHTDGLLIPIITNKNKMFVYTADLLALAAHIAPSWVCGYDTRPLISFEEKKEFLQEACANKYFLVFQHDYYTECCDLKETSRGIEIGKTYKLQDIL